MTLLERISNYFEHQKKIRYIYCATQLQKYLIFIIIKISLGEDKSNVIKAKQ